MKTMFTFLSISCALTVFFTPMGSASVAIASESVPVGASTAGNTPTAVCKDSPRVVASCFSVNGSIGAYNGNPTFRLYTKKGRRLIGLAGEGELSGEQPILPKNLDDILKQNARKMLDAGNVICGKFEVCPFSKSAKGTMQMACINSATGLNLSANAKSCSKQ